MHTHILVHVLFGSTSPSLGHLKDGLHLRRADLRSSGLSERLRILWDLGFGIQDSVGSRVQGLGFRGIQGLGFWGFRGLGSSVKDLGFCGVQQGPKKAIRQGYPTKVYVWVLLGLLIQGFGLSEGLGILGGCGFRAQGLVKDLGFCGVVLSFRECSIGPS